MRDEKGSPLSFFYSKKRVMQGCPLAMLRCGLFILPLIRTLKDEFKDIDSPWYADDEAVGGKVHEILFFQ